MIDGRQNPHISAADLIPERILWPEFFELDGMIFVRDGFDRRMYDSYLKSFRAEEPGHVLSIEVRIERLLNQRYLKDLFLGTGYVPDRRTMRELGEMLEANWQTKLNVQFPGRNMEARFVMEYDNTGFAGWWVTAHRRSQTASVRRIPT